MTKRIIAALWSLLLCLNLSGCMLVIGPEATISLDSLPAYSGEAYVVLENNHPTFTAEELTTYAYENYSSLDLLGRCGTAVACLGRELMPTEERGSIGSVKPSGWQTIKFDFVDGKYLYNRCHLIGFQLAGENANERNLITGTRYMNVEGMLPFENMVADYIKETDNHVMYRVTPLYDGNDLVASGVTMEAYSVEDNGEGICFYVYCYNVQPYVSIDYTTGTAVEAAQDGDTQTTTLSSGYILNTNSKKVHKADCASANKISESNRQDYDGSLDTLLTQGYETAGCCFD